MNKFLKYSLIISGVTTLLGSGMYGAIELGKSIQRLAASGASTSKGDILNIKTDNNGKIIIELISMSGLKVDIYGEVLQSWEETGKSEITIKYKPLPYMTDLTIIVNGGSGTHLPNLMLMEENFSTQRIWPNFLIEYLFNGVVSVIEIHTQGVDRWVYDTRNSYIKIIYNSNDLVNGGEPVIINLYIGENSQDNWNKIIGDLTKFLGNPSHE